jgi:hypothetical protein
MLATLALCLVSLPQDPGALDVHAAFGRELVAPAGRATWRGDGSERVELVGPVELSKFDAVAAAETLAREAWQIELERVGLGLAAEEAPIWLPSFARESAVRRWIRERRKDVPVVDREVIRRDHGFGPSYQARLIVALDRDAWLDRHARKSLARHLRWSSRAFAGVCLSTLLLWGAGSIVFVWLDRLSRGYMTGRLRLVFLAVGMLLPTLAFISL